MLTDAQARYASAVAAESGLHPDVAAAWTAVHTRPTGAPGAGWTGRSPEEAGRRVGRYVARALTPGPHLPVGQLRLIADDPNLPGDWAPLQRAFREIIYSTGGQDVPDPPPTPRLIPTVLAELRAAREAKQAVS